MRGVRAFLGAALLVPGLAMAQLDFGDGGYVTFALTESLGVEGDSLALTGGAGEGDIIAAGRATFGEGTAIILVRYDASGQRDGGFGNVPEQGFVSLLPADILGSGAGVAPSTPVSVLATGETFTVVFATASQELALVRFAQEGSVDTSFGTNGGLIVTPSGSGIQEMPRAATLDSQGRIVVVGHRLVSGQQQAAVWRLEQDGEPDTGFADDGVWVEPTAALTSSSFRAVTLIGDDIVAAGEALQGSEQVFDRTGALTGDLVLRLDASGNPDEQFGVDGEVYLLGEIDEVPVNLASPGGIAAAGGRIAVTGRTMMPGPNLGYFLLLDAETGEVSGDLDDGWRVPLLADGVRAEGRGVAALDEGVFAVTGFGQDAAAQAEALLITRFGPDDDDGFAQIDPAGLYPEVSPSGEHAGGNTARAYGSPAGSVLVAGFSNESGTSRLLLTRGFETPVDDDNDDDNGNGNDNGPIDNPIGGGGSGEPVGGGSSGGGPLGPLGLVLLGLLAVAVVRRRHR